MFWIRRYLSDDEGPAQLECEIIIINMISEIFKFIDNNQGNFNGF